MLSSLLPQIRETWGNTSSSASMSLLLSTTYSSMNLAAKSTNKVAMLGERFKPKPKTSKLFSASSKLSLQLLRNIRKLESSPHTNADELEDARQKLATIRYNFKKEVRDALAKDRDTRDTKLQRHQAPQHSLQSYNSLSITQGSCKEIFTKHKQNESWRQGV